MYSFENRGGEILDRDKKRLFKKVEEISKNICHNYARNCSRLRYSFFPYSKVVRSDYHYHFLVIRKEYRARWIFSIMATVFLVLKLKTSFVFIFACIFTMLSRKNSSVLQSHSQEEEIAYCSERQNSILLPKAR